jgi:uncharacterized protein (TIGR02118 family)
MFKLIVLLKRKPGTSVAEFRDYYETRHAKLVAESAPLMRNYVRNYLTPVGNDLYAIDAAPPYDCVTEAWFDSEEDFTNTVGAILTPEKAAEIAADEERFLDKPAIRWFTVDVVESVLDPTGQQGAR